MCNHNNVHVIITVRSDRETTVAAEKQKVLHTPSMCL
jgi:hypothetical protein